MKPTTMRNSESSRSYARIIFDTLEQRQSASRSCLAKTITKERSVLSPGALSKTLSYLVRTKSIKTHADGRFYCVNHSKNRKKKRSRKSEPESVFDIPEQSENDVTAVKSTTVVEQNKEEIETVCKLRKQLEILENHVATIEKEREYSKTLEKRVLTLEKERKQLKILENHVATLQKEREYFKTLENRVFTLEQEREWLKTLEKRVVTLEQQATALSTNKQVEKTQKKVAKRRRLEQQGASKATKKRVLSGSAQEKPVQIEVKDTGIATTSGSSCLPVEFANMIRGGAIGDSPNSQRPLAWHIKCQGDEKAKWIRLPPHISLKIQQGYETFAIEDRTKHTFVCEQSDCKVQYVSMLGSYCGTNVRFCRM